MRIQSDSGAVWQFNLIFEGDLRKMGELFEVKRAEELLDAEFIAKWEDRRAIDALARTVLHMILERFIAEGGPVKVEAVAALFPGPDPAEIYRAIAQLDEKDLILVRDGQVMLAYPFSGTPTAFRVVLPDGRERYAVCAIDALGVPAMLGHPVTIRSHCYHCREPIEIHVRRDGPIGGAEIMVWVGERGDIRQKACTSICRTLNFFRSEEHLRLWCAAHPDIPGAAALLEEAFKVGARIFGELLRDIY
jgi:hypothetical protein